MKKLSLFQKIWLAVGVLIAGALISKNHAMAVIDQVVQEIADSAQETAGASEELNAQSASMKVIVNELVSMLGMKSDQMTVHTEAQGEITENRADLTLLNAEKLSLTSYS